MLSLSLLLIGRESFREDWRTPACLGMLLVLLSLACVVDFGGIAILLLKALGLLITWRGARRLLMLRRVQRRRVTMWKPAVTTALGLGLFSLTTVDLPFLRLGMVVLLAIDGLTRIPVVGLVRFDEWPEAVTMITFELLLAFILGTGTYLPTALHIPLLLALYLATAGATLLRFAWFLATSPAGSSIHASPLFAYRGWNKSAPARHLARPKAGQPGERMRVWIWTPVAATNSRVPLPFIDYYLMAFDRSGEPSAGHSAIEVAPDFYLSLWPHREIPAQLTRMPHLFYAGESNDIPGIFPPSYQWECDDWMPADRLIDFEHFNQAALEAYWHDYRQSQRYNAGDRNCAIAVAGALETALEGTLKTGSPWRCLMRLMFSGSMIKAAYLRSRARHMCWTPGMVCDYAVALQALIRESNLPRSRSIRPQNGGSREQALDRAA